MKKSNVLILGVAGLTLLLSSCQYDEDPYKDFKSDALNAYNTFYENNKDIEKEPLFYFDIETLRSALVKDGVVTFLGQFNVSNFGFSGSDKYFADLGNIDIGFTTSADGNINGCKIGDFFDSSTQNLDFSNLFTSLPVVLHEILPDGSIATYSRVNKDGTIDDSSNAKAYDPDFFYISDFSLKFDGYDQFDDILNFEGKDLAILRKDVYEFFAKSDFFQLTEFLDNFLNIPLIFKNAYRKVKNLESNDDMPKSITINGTHYHNFTDYREVAVGPFSVVTELIEKLVSSSSDSSEETEEESSNQSLIHKVENIYIGEGVKTISFYAFDGKYGTNNDYGTSSIKNVYLPSTLEEVQFNSLSYLNLDNLYIRKTVDDEGNETAISKVLLEGLDIDLTLGDASLDLTLTGSFAHTSIKNLYFEDFSNLNIASFPYSSITNFKTNDDIVNAISIFHYSDDLYDTSKMDSLTEAFGYYQTINPFYQMNLLSDDADKYTLKSDLTRLKSGKKLFLSYEKKSLETSDSREVLTSESDRKSEHSDALLTLELESDLVIESGAELIVGSQIGFTENESGINAGTFSAINLNGHTITIEDGGILDAYGIIYDSTSKGGVTLNKGGVVNTNISINDYEGLNETVTKVENGVAPFAKYSLNSFEADVTVENGGTINGMISYLSSSLNNENSIELIGNDENALFQAISGKLVVSQSKISSFDSTTKAQINPVTLLTVTDETSYEEEIDEYGNGDIPVAWANSDFELDIANLTLASKLKVESDVILTNVTLGAGASIYVGSDAKLTINGNINVVEDAESVSFVGLNYFGNSTGFNSIKALVDSNNGAVTFGGSYNTISFDGTYNAQVTKITTNFSAYQGDSTTSYTKKIFKNNTGYYYYYESSGNSGKLVNSQGTVLADYSSGDSNWQANSVDTGVSTSNLITSYSYENSETSEVYDAILNNNNTTNTYEWKIMYDIKFDEETCLYSVADDDAKYIKPYGESSLFAGSLTKDINGSNSLFSTEDGDLYYLVNSSYIGDVSSSKTWIKVEFLFNNNAIKIVDEHLSDYQDTYVIYADGVANFGFTVDETKRIAYHSDGTNVISYAYTNDDKFEKFDYSGLKWEYKQINTDSDKMIFLEQSASWARVAELYDGLCRSDSSSSSYHYYFLINDKWYSSVEGTIAVRYNELADMSFGVLDQKLSLDGKKYKFVMKQGQDDNDAFELFLPQSMVKVKSSDYPKLWPEDAATDHLYAYRHIMKRNGDKYLFYKNSEGTIELKKFEYAPGFTPIDPNPDDENVLTMFDFIMYKVIFDGETEVRTIYIIVDDSDENNAIYAGDASYGSGDTSSDNYLAIGVFSDDNPINALIDANM